ncbi:unnamed protein product [Pneumocystis jirovecii]|uniref:Uncharacterized protein n=1 Tax=Pneumocystis jirovecii TaxID=42068 RepID=L0P956_PNEJI|nr:unnamed protein product [Pneumocystis jirovecii]
MQHNICGYNTLYVLTITCIEILEKSVTKILALSSMSITDLATFTDKIENYSFDSAIIFYDFVVCSIIRYYSLNVISKVSLFSGTEFQKRHLSNHIHNLLLFGISGVYLNNVDNLNNCMLNISTLISKIILTLYQTYFARENNDITNIFFDDIKSDSLRYVQCIELVISFYNNNYLKNDIKNINFKGFDIFLQIAFKAKDAPEYDDIIKVIRHVYGNISKIVFGRSISVLMEQKCLDFCGFWAFRIY